MGNLWNKFFFTSGIQADKIVAHIMLSLKFSWLFGFWFTILPLFQFFDRLNKVQSVYPHHCDSFISSATQIIYNGKIRQTFSRPPFSVDARFVT